MMGCKLRDGIMRRVRAIEIKEEEIKKRVEALEVERIQKEKDAQEAEKLRLD